MSKPVLYIFSGLPASGKSTLAMRLAKYTNSIYLRIDTVEQALRELCNDEVVAEGYQLSYRVVRDNLKLGISAVADSCNPLRITRDEWEQVAVGTGANFVNIEVQCSNKLEHQQRAESRIREDIDGRVPTWEQIQRRHYVPWHKQVISIDTAGQSVDQSFDVLIEALNFGN